MNVASLELTRKLQCLFEILASPNLLSRGTDFFISSQTLMFVCCIGFLNVLPPVLIFVGWASSFWFFNFLIIFSISFFSLIFPLNEALKKIKSLSNGLCLYPNFIPEHGIVLILPFLSITWIETKISLNSDPKQPEFILNPPPTVPGIQDKNSKPPILLSRANSDNFLSVTALPATIISFGSKDKLEKFLPNFITTPSNFLSVIKILEPAPKTNTLSFSPNLFKNRTKSSNVSGLK